MLLHGMAAGLLAYVHIFSVRAGVAEEPPVRQVVSHNDIRFLQAPLSLQCQVPDLRGLRRLNRLSLFSCKISSIHLYLLQFFQHPSAAFVKKPACHGAAKVFRFGNGTFCLSAVQLFSVGGSDEGFHGNAALFGHRVNAGGHLAVAPNPCQEGALRANAGSHFFIVEEGQEIQVSSSSLRASTAMTPGRRRECCLPWKYRK